MSRITTTPSLGVIILALAFAALLAPSSAQNCSALHVTYYEYPIKKLNSRDDLGANVTMRCDENPNFYCPDDPVGVGWMIPNLDIIEDSNGKYQLSDDKLEFTVVDTIETDFGLYHCMLRWDGGSQWYMVKFGINTQGPYFEDLWEKYELNTIIGLSATAGFLLLCLACWLLWKYRWVDPDQPDPTLDEYTGKKMEDGYQNKGFTANDEQTPSISTASTVPIDAYVPCVDKNPDPGNGDDGGLLRRPRAAVVIPPASRSNVYETVDEVGSGEAAGTTETTFTIGGDDEGTPETTKKNGDSSEVTQENQSRGSTDDAMDDVINSLDDVIGDADAGSTEDEEFTAF